MKTTRKKKGVFKESVTFEVTGTPKSGKTTYLADIILYALGIMTQYKQVNIRYGTSGCTEKEITRRVASLNEGK